MSNSKTNVKVDQIKSGGSSVEPGGVSCREYKGETKSVKRIQSMEETVESVTRIPE